MAILGELIFANSRRDTDIAPAPAAKTVVKRMAIKCGGGFGVFRI